MKLEIKSVTLRSDTERDIASGVTDEKIIKFINYIKEHITYANFLINNRIDMMDADTLYNALIKVFNISFDASDYLKMLARREKVNYTRLIRVQTNMMDKGKSVAFLGAATSKISFYDGTVIDVKTLRRITSSFDFLIIQKIDNPDYVPKCPLRLENYCALEIDVSKGEIDEDSELFPDAKALIRREILVKDVLYVLKWYVKEINFQARGITDLSRAKDENKAMIGKRYKRALDMAFNDHVIPKREKVSVRKHKKIKAKDSFQ